MRTTPGSESQRQDLVASRPCRQLDADALIVCARDDGAVEAPGVGRLGEQTPYQRAVRIGAQAAFSGAISLSRLTAAR